MTERRTTPRLDPAADEPDGVFSDAYLKIRSRYLSLQPARPSLNTLSKDNGFLKDAPSLTEKSLRAIWYESRFDRRGLVTTGGERLSILRPGEWNLDAGPDFRGAEIRIGEKTFKGDVELHITPRDWKNHGHDRDPAYNDVVLHVYLLSSPRPFQVRASNGREIPSICLEGRLPQPMSTFIQNFDAEGYPFNSHCGLGACGKKMNLRRYDFLERFLRLAGDGRILLKADRLTSNGERFDAKEAFYRKTAECLGYQPNKASMAGLCERLPWRTLKTIVRDHGAQGQQDVIESLLFGAAGLLPAPSREWDEETNERLEILNKVWKKHQSEVPESSEAIAWTTRRLRPVNYPHRRLAGLAVLIAQLLNENDDDDRYFLAQTKENGSSQKKSAGTSPFFVGPIGYFARRCRWGSKPFRHAAALVGDDRAQVIWTNAFLPVALRLSRSMKNEEAERLLHRRFVQLPLREPNGPARLMAHRLLGSEGSRRFPLVRERQQQGLLQIFQDFCDTKPWACGVCVFPQVMELSTSELNAG